MTTTRDMQVTPVTVRRTYLTAFGLSKFGDGMVLPLTALFLVKVLDAPASFVALYFGLMTVTAVIVNPLAGWASDRWGPRQVARLALPVQMAGSFALAASTEPALALGAAVVTGAGNGCVYAVQTPLVAKLFTRDELSGVFGAQYMIMNVGVAVAAVLSTGMVGAWGEPAYRAVFAFNGLSYGVYGLLVLGALGTRLAQAAHQPAPGGSAAWRPYLDVSFLPLVLVQLCAVVFGFAMIEAVLPLMIDEVRGLPLATVGLVMAANAVAVVLTQRSSVGVVARIGFVRALVRALLLFAASFLVAASGLAVGDRAPHAVLGLLIAFGVVFAAGETLLSASLRPLLVDLVPEGRIGVYSASLSMAVSVGMALGPAIGVVLLHTVGGPSTWVVCCVGTLAVLAVLRARADDLSRSAERGGREPR